MPFRFVPQDRPEGGRRRRPAAGVQQAARNLAPRKQPQQERSSARVDLVLASALTLLAEEGAAALTTRAIAARAGLPVGSIYQYFPNKQAILALLAQRWLSQFRETLRRQTEQPPPATWAAFRRAFRDVHHASAGIYQRNRELLCVLESLPFDPELRRMEEAHDREMTDRISRWLVAINPDLPRPVAVRLCRAWLAGAHAILAGVVVASPAQFDAAVDDIERMCLALLRPHLGLS